MTYANHATYTDNYYEDTGTGLVWKFVDCAYTEAAGDLKVTGGAVDIAGTATFISYFYDIYYNTFYPSLKVLNNTVYTDGTGHNYYSVNDAIGKYYTHNGNVYKLSSVKWIENVQRYEWKGYLVSSAGDDTYTWQFKAVTASASTSDNEVRGLWSGYVNSLPMINAGLQRPNCGL